VLHAGGHCEAGPLASAREKDTGEQTSEGGMTMKMHSQGMVRLALLATSVAMVASIGACKQREEPTPTPAPQAAQNEVTQHESGTTTTFAPPAPAPQAAPASPAAQ
jgi:hypothetical protein